MKKILSVFLLAFFLIPSKINAQEIFSLNPVTDGILSGTGFILNGTYLILDKAVLEKRIFDNNAENLPQVPALDKPLMNPYNKKLDKAGTITVATTLLSPAILALAPSNEWLTIAVMYAESALLANGIKEITKISVNRPRPYMYFDGYPQNKVDEGDWCKSFPSGHTTLAFMGATFGTYVFSRYFPDSPWRYAVGTAFYALAFTTAGLRLASGNHFLTDILGGALIGTSCGILVPYLHTNKTQTNAPSISLSANTIGICIKY